MRAPFLKPSALLPIAAAVCVWLQADGLAQSFPGVPLDAPPPVSVTTAVDGESLLATYHFDHNALLTALRSGDMLIALTNSGNLVRFDAATLRMTGEYVAPDEITTVAEGAGRVLIGTRAGTVDEIDPKTWNRTRVGSCRGSILWIGRHAASTGLQTVVVAANIAEFAEFLPWPGERVPDYEARSERSTKGLPFVTVTVFGVSPPRSFDLTKDRKKVALGSFALDGAGRLWMGADHGEFGGALARVDLSSGAVTPVDFKQPVIGFVRSPDGSMLAYGGLSHLGTDEGFITRLDPQGPHNVATFADDDLKPAPSFLLRMTDPDDPEVREYEKRLRSAGRPWGPIDRLTLDASQQGYWASSNQMLFHANLDFTRWTLVRELDGRWFGGRKFSAANTPTVNAVLTDPTDTASAIVAFGRDGLARAGANGGERRWFGGQLENTGEAMFPAPDGLMVVSQGVVWSISPRGWTVTELGLPDGSCYDTPVLGQNSGDLAILCRSPSTHGDNLLLRLRTDGTREIRQSWTGDGFGDWLSTHDGQIINIDDGQLNLFERGSSRVIGRDLRHGHDVNAIRADYAQQFLPLAETDTAEYFLDAGYGEVVTLTKGTPVAWQLADYSEAGRRAPDRILDASKERDGWVLVASPAGIIRFHPADGARSSIRAPNKTEVFTTIARDTRGRLWIAGERVYRSIDEGTHWTVVDLPVSAPLARKRIRPNAVSGGVWITLGARGLIVLN